MYRGMTAKSDTEREPKPFTTLSAFEDGDFNALSPTCAENSLYDEPRLRLRRKLATLAKAFSALPAASELDFLARTSLHRPYQFNANRVRRMWTYICRGKKSKTALRKVIGRDLAKDLDAAYRNAYLCLAMEHDALEVSLRIHVDAWYDGQNLVNRVKRNGLDEWLEVLNRLDGFFLRLADWKGEWRCGELKSEQLEEFLRFYEPGKHSLAVERRYPAPQGGRAPYLTDEAPSMMIEELSALGRAVSFHRLVRRERSFVF